jgi:phosphomannomutase
MNELYQQWYNSDRITDLERVELKNLTEQEIAAYFKNEKLHFGTAGIRARLGLGTQKLNRFTYGQIFHAFAKYIKLNIFRSVPVIIIGHDNRYLSKKMTVLAAKILNSYGIKAILFPHNMLIPTPIISYAVHELRTDGAINITASHNPKDDNGVKLYNLLAAQVCDEIPEIEKYFCEVKDIINLPNEELPLTNIKYLKFDIIKRYFADAKNVVLNTVELHNNQKLHKIVLNTNQGTASKLLPHFLRQIGFRIKPVRKQQIIRSDFNHTKDSNPENIASFEQAFAYADKINSKICIGVDPDADRMAVAIKKHGKWNLLDGNQTGTILTYYILNNRHFINQPFVVASYVTTNIVDRIAAHFGANVFRTGTGFKNLGKKVIEKSATGSLAIAFEESIGALVSNIDCDKDSFTASALILEIFTLYQKRHMDLLDLLNDEIYPHFGYNYTKSVSFVIKDLN